MPEPSQNFDGVVFDSADPNDCSPELDEFDVEYRGIKINAPPKVGLVVDVGEDEEEAPRVSKSTRFAMCIAVQMSQDRLGAYAEPVAAISVVAVNKANARHFSASLEATRAREPLPPPNLSADELARRVGRLYYNVNLCDYLELPPEPATYYAYAAFDEHRSNTVEVQLE